MIVAPVTRRLQPVVSRQALEMPHGEPREALGFERVGAEFALFDAAHITKQVAEHAHDDGVLHAAARVNDINEGGVGRRCSVGRVAARLDRLCAR